MLFTCTFSGLRRDLSTERKANKRLEMRGSTLAVMLVAVTLMLCQGCHAQFTLGSSFTINRTVLIPQEGVAFESFIFQDNTRGKIWQGTRTPNGYTDQFTFVDLLSKQATVYITYTVNNSAICYVYAAGQVPWPFPNTPQSFSYLKRGVYDGEAMGVFQLNVGRYVRRMTTNVLSVPTGSVFRAVTSNNEAMNNVADVYVQNNTGSPASVFALPPACTSGNARLLRAKPTTTNMFASSRETAFSVNPLRVPPEVKFNVRDASNAQEEFFMMLEEVRRTYQLGSSLTEYSPSNVKQILQTVSSIDNRAYATGIRNQGDCGACWAFSTVAVTETVYNYKHNITNPVGSSNAWLSVQNIIDCATGDLNGTALFPSKGCLGGWPLVGLSHIVVSGVVPESAYTFDGTNGLSCQQSSSGASSLFPLAGAQYISISNGATTNLPILMTAVVNEGAVIAIMNANPILFYPGGIFINPACTASLGHAVVLIGFGTDEQTGLDYWIVKNSFGSGWGEGGFFRIQRGVNLCGIEQMGFVAIAK